jgi:hypothetical protein
MLQSAMADERDDEREDERGDPGPPVELSDDETAVMLGTFAGASFTELASSTGLPPPHLEAIVTRLTRLGLIEPQLIPLEPEAGEGEDIVTVVATSVRERAGHDDPPSADDGLVALLDGALDGLVPLGPEEVSPPPAAPKHRVTPAQRPLDPPPPPETDETVELAVDEPRPEAAGDTREYLKLFETELHPLPVDERVALAETETGARLFALCFDPDPRVVRAVLDNPGTTLEHARLLAFHHRTARGVDELVRRPAIAADPMVHRRLVRNPAVDEGMFRRLMGNKRLLEVYKVSLDRDVPDRSRAAARTLFRTKFGTSQAEERVEIVWATEGRVLMAMSGLTFDSRTTSILCSRTYASIMLIQNLARFPATPPQLIGHLLRQPMVKRQPHLKNQLLQHPNTPSDAKRRL